MILARFSRPCALYRAGEGFACIRNPLHKSPRRLPSGPRSYAVKYPTMRSPRSELNRPPGTGTEPEQALPADTGILAGTRLRPEWQDVPSIFTRPRHRLILEVGRLGYRIACLLGLMLYKIGRKGTAANRIKLGLFNQRLGRLAATLQAEMCTALADGNIRKINDICEDGLASSLRKHIARRPKDVKLRWTVSAYLTRPRVLSHKGGFFRKTGNAGRRQAVVRVESNQILERISAEGVPLLEMANKPVVEWVVIQRTRGISGEGPWKLWGTLDRRQMKANPYPD